MVTVLKHVNAYTPISVHNTHTQCSFLVNLLACDLSSRNDNDTTEPLKGQGVIF